MLVAMPPLWGPSLQPQNGMGPLGVSGDLLGVSPRRGRWAGGGGSWGQESLAVPHCLPVSVTALKPSGCYCLVPTTAPPAPSEFREWKGALSLSPLLSTGWASCAKSCLDRE